MFIPWLSEKLIPDNMHDIDLEKIFVWDENAYNSILEDKRIKELLRTNSLFVESHGCEYEPSLNQMLSISIDKAIGTITDILLDGIEFKMLKNNMANNIFKSVNLSSLYAIRRCIYNAYIKEMKLVKIDIGYKENSKFILI